MNRLSRYDVSRYEYPPSSEWMAAYVLIGAPSPAGPNKKGLRETSAKSLVWVGAIRGECTISSDPE